MLYRLKMINAKCVDPEVHQISKYKFGRSIISYSASVFEIEQSRNHP